jgi:diguanylate cyclase
MNARPYSDRYERASEHLRLALALLSEHRIPPSPLNYRLGYDYAAGNHATLRKAIDASLARTGELTENRLWELYQQAYVQDDEALDAMRQALRAIIDDVQKDFKCSGDSLSAYVQTLDRFAELLDTSTSSETMMIEVNKVIADTRSAERSQRQFSTELTRVVAEVESLRKELEQVREESQTDGLTGILNRKAFDATLERSIHSARESHTPFCVLLIDIDHFKHFNDTFGHLVGDKVLRFVAATLKRCVKGKDTVARYGGEEFIVILPQTDLAGATTVAEQIRTSVSAGDLKDKKDNESYGRITVSTGIAEFVVSDLPHQLIHRADQALYLAKAHGRNRIEQAA